MNKKGFTLVELLAVIALLGVVIVLTMTNGFGLFNNAKRGINEIEENNLIEAAKVFLVDVKNDFVNNYPDGCSQSDFINGSSCKVKVSYIIDNYMDKKPDSCNENMYFELSIKEDDEIEYMVKPTDKDGNEVVICSN